jgi:hypothetical protein
VNELASPALSEWQSFYVMLGSAAGALIGVQFVVIALIANSRRPATAEAISAFATPTVVHFTSVLLVAAIMSVPSPSLFPRSIALAICSLGGIGYGGIVIRRARRQRDYRPQWEDWVWYAPLPCGVYAALGVAAVFLGKVVLPAAFTTGASAIALLLIGIHNAWDSVTHIVVALHHGDEERAREARNDSET